MARLRNDVDATVHLPRDLGSGAMTNDPWRLVVDGRWIHRRSFPQQDKVLWNTGDVEVCQGQPSGAEGQYQ